MKLLGFTGAKAIRIDEMEATRGQQTQAPAYVHRAPVDQAFVLGKAENSDKKWSFLSTSSSKFL